MRRWGYAAVVVAIFGWVGTSAWAQSPKRGGIKATYQRPPTYWGCQDNLKSRMTVTILSTQPPTAIIERSGTRVIATLQESGSGAKYMAPGGVLFWIKGKEATVQWPPSPTAFQCANLGG
jgi:membrane-bound inhibitor of C-type lysozyme